MFDLIVLGCNYVSFMSQTCGLIFMSAYEYSFHEY